MRIFAIYYFIIKISFILSVLFSIFSMRDKVGFLKNLSWLLALILASINFIFYLKIKLELVWNWTLLREQAGTPGVEDNFPQMAGDFLNNTLNIMSWGSVFVIVTLFVTIVFERSWKTNVQTKT